MVCVCFLPEFAFEQFLYKLEAFIFVVANSSVASNRNHLSHCVCYSNNYARSSTLANG